MEVGMFFGRFFWLNEKIYLQSGIKQKQWKIFKKIWYEIKPRFVRTFPGLSATRYVWSFRREAPSIIPWVFPLFIFKYSYGVFALLSFALILTPFVSAISPAHQWIRQRSRISKPGFKPGSTIFKIQYHITMITMDVTPGSMTREEKTKIKKWKSSTARRCETTWEKSTPPACPGGGSPAKNKSVD